MKTRRVPPLAGICTYKEATKVGYTVDQNVDFLKRYHHVKQKLKDIIALHMNSIPEWEVKGALSYQIWIDSEHITWIRKRVSEMRQPPLHLDRVPDERLDLLMSELLHSENTVELLVGMYSVVRSALLEAFKKHVDETNPLVDQPTRRILQFMITEEEQSLAWGREAIEALTEDETSKVIAAQWHDHLQSYLLHAGGMQGLEESDVTLPKKRSDKPFEASFVPIRDERFSDIWNNDDVADQVYKDESKDADERTWSLLFKRLREMDVPEMMCSIVAETKDKPWEYYHDMNRQIWDEVRHSMMGEVAFVDRGIDWTKLPIRINWAFELNTLLTPLERHAVLYDIEFGLMPGDTGKRYEWEITKESSYRLAETFHDHDWADEVLHAQIGRKWFVSEVGNNKAALELAQQAYKKIAENRPEYTIENKDWWDQVYSEIKEKQSIFEKEQT